MCSPKILFSVLAVAILNVAILESATAKGVVIGIGAAGDTADGRAYSLFADVGATEKTWISGAISRNQTKNTAFDLDAKFADISVDHFFDPVGLRLGGS